MNSQPRPHTAQRARSRMSIRRSALTCIGGMGLVATAAACQAVVPSAGTPTPGASSVERPATQPSTVLETQSGTLSKPSPSTRGNTEHSSPTSGSSANGAIDAADPLLARQLNIAIYGGGGEGGPSCEAYDSTAPASSEPGIALQGASLNDFPKDVELCLTGFDATSRIALTATVGPRQYRTDAIPSANAYPGSGQGPEPGMPVTTLFVNGKDVAVYSRTRDGSPIPGPNRPLSSLTWRFLPPRAVRDDIVRHGQFSISAVQGAHTASQTIRVRAPEEREYSIVPQGGLPTRYLFVIRGLPSGSTAPVGLYRYFPYRNGSQPYAKLVKQLGRVQVPLSRIAVFPVPYQAVEAAGPGVYCLLPPEDSEPTCASLTILPGYPGRATAGDRGTVVRRWQEIFITVGLLDNEPANRDGYYGPRMQTVVKEYLGIARARPAPALDRELYARFSNF